MVPPVGTVCGLEWDGAPVGTVCGPEWDGAPSVGTVRAGMGWCPLLGKMMTK